MIPTRNLVIEIRTLLASQGDVQKDALAKLVWEYGNTCRRVNEKAQRCLELLRQGHRVDAMHLAKEPPDLQQEILLLDFTERPQWIDLCDRAGMPISETFDPQALYSMAQELYAESGTLDHLLRMHRRMAMGRAPIADRLRTLRRIRQADPKDEFWKDDIRAYEAVLLKELLDCAEKANKEADLPALEDVLGELQSPDWLVKPPPAHVRAIERIIQPYRQRLADARFDKLAEQIHHAFSKLDEAQCCDLLAQWQQTIDETGAQPNAGKADHMAGIQKWLDDLQRTRDEEATYQRACETLDRAIETSYDKGLLQRLENDVMAFSRGVSEISIGRLRDRIDEINALRRRRTVLIAIGIVGGILLLGAGVTAIAVWQYEVNRVAGTLQAADDNIAAGTEESLKKAKARLAELLAERPDDKAIEARLKDVDKKLQDLAFKHMEFTQAMAEIDKRIAGMESALKEPLPDAQGMAGLRELANRTSDADARARNIRENLQVQAPKAGSPPQKELVEKYKKRIQACVDAAHGTYESAFKKQLDVLQEKYNALAADKAASTSKIDDLKKRGRDFLTECGDMPRFPDPQKNHKDGLASLENAAIKTLADIENFTEEERRRREALGRIAKGYHSSESLATELTNYAAKYPADQPRSGDFVKAARLAPAWRAATLWQTIIEGYGKQIRTHDSREIGKRLPQLQKYLTDNPQTPHKAAAEQYQAYLQTGNDVLVNSRLKDLPVTMALLKSAAFRDLWMVRAKDGRKFYMKDKKDYREQVVNSRIVGYGLDHIIDGTLNTKAASLPFGEIAGELVVAPQTEFSRKAIELILKNTGGNWETFYLELGQMAMDYPDMDPILVASILKLDILPRAAATTPGGVPKIQPLITLLDSLNLTDVAWMNPGDADANSQRPEAALVLKHLGNLSAIAKDVTADLDRLAILMAPAFRPVGVLLPAEDGSLPLDRGSGALYVLWDNSGAATPEYKKIGSRLGDKFKEEPGALVRYPKGSLVFELIP